MGFAIPPVRRWGIAPCPSNLNLAMRFALVTIFGRTDAHRDMKKHFLLGLPTVRLSPWCHRKRRGMLISPEWSHG